MGEIAKSMVGKRFTFFVNFTHQFIHTKVTAK